jgi:hypothetical protein
MTFGLSISGSGPVDKDAVEAIGREAHSKLKALDGATTVSLSGWVGLEGGGSYTISQPAEPAPAEDAQPPA